MALMVLCKNRRCGSAHSSELQMEQKSFRVAVLDNVSERCPKCGKYSLYGKEEYFYKV